MVLTANGEVHTNEETQVYVHDFKLFATVQFLKETLVVLSLGKVCEDHGYSYEWVSGQKVFQGYPPVLEQFVVNIDIAGFVFNKSSPNAKRKDARFPFSQQTAGSWKNEIRSIRSPARLRNSLRNQTLTLSHTRSVCLQ